MPRDILEAQARELRRLQHLESRRALRITRAALAKVRARLSNARLGAWDRAAHTATMHQLSRGVRELAAAQAARLSVAIGQYAATSWTHTADLLQHLDQAYVGAVRPLRFDALEWLETNRQQLSQVRLQEYRRSFARYGAGAVRAIEEEVAGAVLVGEPWSAARGKVWEAVRDVVGDRQWMVDRILRTEASAAYNGIRLAALLEEDRPDDPMSKMLITTFDEVTGEDSIMLHEQVRPVREPFYDAYFDKYYMAPPNRPHDREILVGWRQSYGDPDLPDLRSGPPATSPRKAAPAGKRRRARLGKLRRSLDRQIQALEGETRAGSSTAPAQASLLRRRRDALTREMSSLSGFQDLPARPLLLPAHRALLRLIRLGRRVKSTALVEYLLRQRLVERRTRRGRSVLVLTAAGLAAARPDSPPER